MTAPPPSVRLTSLEVPGPAGPLEALLQEHAGVDHPIAALVLHPHPLYGGTFHNKVVHRTASVLVGLGAAVLRINFRGVGASAGHFDQGRGELEDARAAWGWLAARHPESRLWLAGFSFGSWVAARLAAAEPNCERVVLVAPPAGTHDFSVMKHSAVPKLVIQGTADDVCPQARLDEQYPGWAELKRLVLVPGASHFFDRKLTEFGHALEEGLSGAAAEAGR